jgi:hypothetical protein
VKFSVVFVTVGLSVFCEKVKSNLGFQRNCGVKLIIVGKNVEFICALLAVFNVFREEAELHVIGKYAE